jgi:predicted nucleotidyltransferase
MMDFNKIGAIISENFSNVFPDFRGVYLFGSRIKGNSSIESDYDIVMIFDYIDYDKRLNIAGLITDIEYNLNISIDYKILTSSGNRSIEYIRNNVNPFFISQSIDNGLFYARI